MSARRSKLEGVVKCLAAAEGVTFATCVGIAKSHFNSHFVLAIKQLLHNFPPDYVDASTGVKFWTGVKRAPVAAVLDTADPLHHAFLAHSAALVASNFGCPLPQGWDMPEVLHPLVAAHVVPEFVPKNVRIKAGENDATVEGADDDRDAADALAKQLATMGECWRCGWVSESSGSHSPASPQLRLWALLALRASASLQQSLRRMTTRITTLTLSQPLPTCARATTRSTRQRAMLSR